MQRREYLLDVARRAKHVLRAGDATMGLRIDPEEDVVLVLQAKDAMIVAEWIRTSLATRVRPEKRGSDSGPSA